MTSSAATNRSVAPFDRPGRWFRGNLHVHSTASDGDRSPEQVIQFYRQKGYHFLAFTDHRILSLGQQMADDFITISGIEVDGRDPASGLYHLVGLGTALQPDIPYDLPLPLQDAVDRMRAAQGLVMLAHPYWSGQMSRDLLHLEGCFGLEVYNGSCDVDDAKGFSAVHWDDLLAAGRLTYGLATDDAHWRSGTKDAGLGWVWVKAVQLTQQAILDALAVGHFYASCGPRIEDLRFDTQQRSLSVRTSPVTAIDLVGNAWRSHRLAAPPGQTLTEATYHLRSGQTYVRVACRDSLGHWAWSNPIFTGT
jgi:hypothetical protein